MASIHFITGGQRSGKSSYALKIAENLSENPVYIATAKVWDDEFANRIERHKQERGDNWINYEAELFVSKCNIDKKVVLFKEEVDRLKRENKCLKLDIETKMKRT